MEKLQDLINSLNKEEFLRFENFLKSPFFNTRTDLVKLYDFFRKELPLKEINHETIYKKVYGETSYNQQVVDNLLSRMKKTVITFIKQIGFEKDNSAQTHVFAYELARKNLNKTAEKIINEALSKLENEHYTVEYLKKYYEYVELKESLVVNIKNYNLKLSNTYVRSESLVNYFILNLLRIANDLVAFKYVTSFKEDEEIFNGFLNFFDFKSYLVNLEKINSPFYAITAVSYYGLMSKLDDPDAEYREKLKKVVFENLDKMNYHDQATCWTMLFASYVFTNTPQKHNVSPEVHEINKFFISKNIYGTDELGYIFSSNYHNIAFHAIAAKDYVWAENFLKTFKIKLAPGTPDDFYNICMAKMLFEKESYEECLKFLSSVRISNVMDKINLTETQIKCFYELGYYEEALSAIEAYKSFFMVNKSVTTNLRKGGLGFVKNIRLIVKSTALHKKLNIGQYQRAEKTLMVNNKHWILKKMKEHLE